MARKLLLLISLFAFAAPSAFAARVCAVSLLFSDTEERIFQEEVRKAGEARGTRLDSEVLWTFGVSGINTCLDPRNGFEGIYLLAHSGRLEDGKSTLLILNSGSGANGEAQAFSLPDKVFTRLARQEGPLALRRIGISTCYSAGLRANFPRLFSLERRDPAVTIEFSDPASLLTTGAAAAEEFYRFLEGF